ncbi:MAG: class I SAM-dependent methyltransferase [Verrucomicrobia bacterium]|nr:class I SAM-dependent methyltransferase [Verrucomicrobiota bacterium]
MSSAPQTQQKHSEWHEQWSMFADDERFLFNDWIAPATLEDFRGKAVLECGCGGGQHTSYVAPLAARVVAVDLNTADIARERNAQFKNVEFVQADIAGMELGGQFDVVYCIGVIHHTDDPDRTFASIYKHCKPGGKVIIWTYSAEGNALVRFLVEPVRKLFLARLSRRTLAGISRVITALLYPVVHTIYRLPFLSFLPYYKYFQNFRRLYFERNMLNVFDKLNAPQTRFTTLRKCHEWFSPERFEPASISIRPYAGVSYSLVGVKRAGDPSPRA